MEFTKKESAKAKGAAVLLLFFHHLFFMDRGYPVKPWLLSEELLRNIAIGSRVCVWIFVFVASYGVTVLYERKPEEETITQFVFARWFSLMKSFWFIYIPVFFILLIAGKNPMQVYGGSILCVLLDFLGWSDFFGTPTLCGAWWYMCLAQMIVILIPLLAQFCKKMGGFLSIFACFLGTCFVTGGIVSKSGGDYLMYLMAILFGIVCMQSGFFERISFRQGVRAAFQWCLILGAVIGLIVSRFAVVSEHFIYNGHNIHWVFYSAAAVGICMLTFLIRTRYIEEVLVFLGKHSGNMFFIHMLYVKHLGKYLYATRTVAGTWIILIAVSVLTSIVIEAAKKATGYQGAMQGLEKKLKAKLV